MTSRPRIVFVDDEASVLAGLRRQLWERREAWDMVFVPGGTEALARLQEAPADVIVSDMRMPGMDGAALLEQVRQRWPATVRILLTGYTDQEQGLRSARSAHQFLNKPCDPAMLREALAHALALGALVPDAGLRCDLARLVALPLLGGMQQRIQQELDRPNASLRRLGELVEHDPGLAAKSLQMVNSAAMALPQRVLRPAQAVALLGMDHVRSLWQALTVRRALRQDGDHEDEAAMGHAETVALATQEALRRLGDEGVRLGFSAGLLHDVGALALRHTRPQAWEQCRRTGSLEMERRACGADHAAAGAYLLGLWGLPTRVVDAVARHHHPADPEEALQAALAHAEASVGMHILNAA